MVEQSPFQREGARNATCGEVMLQYLFGETCDVSGGDLCADYIRARGYCMTPVSSMTTPGAGACSTFALLRPCGREYHWTGIKFTSDSHVEFLEFTTLLKLRTGEEVEALVDLCDTGLLWRIESTASSSRAPSDWNDGYWSRVMGRTSNISANLQELLEQEVRITFSPQVARTKKAGGRAVCDLCPNRHFRDESRLMDHGVHHMNCPVLRAGLGNTQKRVIANLYQLDQVRQGVAYVFNAAQPDVSQHASTYLKRSAELIRNTSVLKTYLIATDGVVWSVWITMAHGSAQRHHPTLSM